jgi:SPP1 gp7 family putative phage head morphogenesis protein
VRPNAGVEIAYRRKLERLIDEMHRSVDYWLRAAYRANEPEVMALASDASPAVELNRTFNALKRRWLSRFKGASGELAGYFSKDATDRADMALRGILKRSGFAVKFKTTAAVNDVLQATIKENIGLITNLPEQYLTQVQGHVMRSVQAGRDLSYLTTKLREQYGITKRRAATIARDQNNKASAVITRVRQQEIGVTEAIWIHSYAGRHPRKSHVENDGKRYDVAKGWFDPDAREWCWPGTQINCRCISRSIIPGLAASVTKPSAALRDLKQQAEERAR